MRLELHRRRPPPRSPRACARTVAGRVGADACARSSRPCASAATRRCSSTSGSFGGGERAAGARASELDGGAGARSTRRVRAGLEVGDRQRARGRRGRAATPRPRSTLPQGQTVRLREVPVRRAAVYAPGGPQPVPVDGGHGRGHGPRRRRRRGRRSPRPAGTRRSSPPPRCAGSTRCTGWAARRRSPRSPTAPRRSRRVDVIVGPGSLWVQEAKRQVSGDVGIDGFAGPERPDGDRVRGRRPRAAARSTCWRRPSTARARWWSP